ncbi:hypothetical protein TNCV_2171941 [Trichonephila clavipes]|nr:hypothetical protein TNCV_2171941 [Trichonephila clavipes]
MFENCWGGHEDRSNTLVEPRVQEFDICHQILPTSVGERDENVFGHSINIRPYLADDVKGHTKNGRTYAATKFFSKIIGRALLRYPSRYKAERGLMMLLRLFSARVLPAHKHQVAIPVRSRSGDLLHSGLELIPAKDISLPFVTIKSSPLRSTSIKDTNRSPSQDITKRYQVGSLGSHCK